MQIQMTTVESVSNLLKKWPIKSETEPNSQTTSRAVLYSIELQYWTTVIYFQNLIGEGFRYSFYPASFEF